MIYTRDVRPSESVTPVRWARMWTGSAVLILAFTGVLKLFGATGDAQVLSHADPLFGFLSNRQVMLLGAAIEILVILLVLREADVFHKVAMIGTLGGVFLVYRIGLWGIGYEGSCSCLGQVTDVLGVSAAAADLISKIILGYLLIGSYSVLAWATLGRWSIGQRLSRGRPA
jgi:hypothetical protein